MAVRPSELFWALHRPLRTPFFRCSQRVALLPCQRSSFRQSLSRDDERSLFAAFLHPHLDQLADNTALFTAFYFTIFTAFSLSFAASDLCGVRRSVHVPFPRSLASSKQAPLQQPLLATIRHPQSHPD